MITRFDQKNFHDLCDAVAGKDDRLAMVISKFGYPPMWKRRPGFATLIRIILEQQVSLASARAAYNKLRNRVGTVTAEKLLALSDSELKACYFSRQKIRYAREVAMSVRSRRLRLAQMALMPDEEIRSKLIEVKGIGNWTIDVYLLFTLQRSDIFPVGDIAVVKALKELRNLPAATPPQALLQLAEHWRPNRSIATMLLWHYYIQTRNMKVPFR